MFSGIIERSVPIVHILSSEKGMRLSINVDFPVTIGESIAINGCCLTIAESIGEQVFFDVGPLTLKVTNLSRLKPGSYVNLERSLKMGEGISGHLVSGHVDTLAKVLEIKEQEGSRLMTFSYPDVKSAIVIDKGSICLNGVSLTLQSLQKDQDALLFKVMIIPTTWETTNLRFLQAGDVVNVEWDMIGKWVAKWIGPHKV